jgi:hypothetical protein
MHSTAARYAFMRASVAVKLSVAYAGVFRCPEAGP